MKIRLGSVPVDELVDIAISLATNQYWCFMEDSYRYEGLKPATRFCVYIFVGDEDCSMYVPIEYFSEFIESPLNFLIGSFWKGYRRRNDITTELDGMTYVNFFEIVEDKANST